MLATEQTDRSEAKQPTEPTERMDPAEPIDKIEPAEPIDRIDPLDPMLRIDPAEPGECPPLPLEPIWSFSHSRVWPDRGTYLSADLAASSAPQDVG